MKPNLPAALALSGLLASCANFDYFNYFNSKPGALNMNSAVLKAESYESQEALADYYAKSAADMQARANEARLLGSQYEGKTYLYDSEAGETVDRTRKLADLYDRAAADNRRMAEIHRRVAVQLPCKPMGISGKGGLIPCHLPTEKNASKVGRNP
jgi:hypothetical protein